MPIGAVILTETCGIVPKAGGIEALSALTGGLVLGWGRL